LPAVLTETEFDALVGGLIERVYRATLALKPTAQIVLDKVPQNGRAAETILRFVPDARFIHVIRDGRDVAASMLRASRGWGREWAPRNAGSAAATWRYDVELCQAIAQRTGAYLEIRHEELLSDRGSIVLRNALRFCGVTATEQECADTCAAFALHDGHAPRTSLVWGGEVLRRRGTAPPEPAGFAGTGGIARWKRELDLLARAAVQREAGSALRALGYADSSSWVGLTMVRCPAVAAIALLQFINPGRHTIAGIVPPPPAARRRTLVLGWAVKLYRSRPRADGLRTRRGSQGA